MRAPRRWVRRATLSALAGGGLTAASLSGPLAGGALGAMPAGPSGAPEGTNAPATAPEVVGTGGGSSSHKPRTTTTSSTSAPTSTAPQPSGATGSPGPEAPAVVVQRKQKATPSAKSTNPSATPTKPGSAPKAGKGKAKSAVPSGPNNVALPPQVVAGEAGALAAELASSAASAQALAFYRIPLFLLPIYQAAAVQYGVPWQILAAINEIETNFGVDQSVSTAGAVGWMQFMPATWLQYGVDALDAGYADPYNPVDAIFAAARYLRAAGAQNDLHTAIFAYNHSDEYVNSVFLRAKLISTYPKAVIATLTGLIDDGLPVTGSQLAWGQLLSAIPSSSATANATAKPSASAGATGAQGRVAAGSSSPPTPAVAGAVAAGQAATSPQPPQFVDLMSARNASVVAVQDGKIVQLGSSRALGKYVTLQDVYGDVFTYAGLGSIAPTYTPPKAPKTAQAKSGATGATGAAGTAPDPAPARPATAGTQPLTLHVKTPTAAKTAPTLVAVPAGSAESTPRGMGRLRLFAHPGNPDALAAEAARARTSARHVGPDGPFPLRTGSVVSKGTVLGEVRTPLGAKSGHIRFAIRPARDINTIDPRPILENWAQLNTALHPQGAKGEPGLLGATASDVFLFSKSQLQREVLSDPGIVMAACSRHEVSAGAIDKRVLAVIAFLSRSGLKPTVAALRCGGGEYDVAGYVPVNHIGDAVAISKIDGVPIAGHQGTGSITDTTIRTLLTLQGEFVPSQIVSLMKYPGAPSTLARPDHGSYIEVVFRPAPKRTTAPATASRSGAAHSAGAGQTARLPFLVGQELSTRQWNELIARIGTLPVPVVQVKPSSSAIPDPKTP